VSLIAGSRHDGETPRFSVPRQRLEDIDDTPADAGARSAIATLAASPGGS
jgi:hypothetical protein